MRESASAEDSGAERKATELRSIAPAEQDRHQSEYRLTDAYSEISIRPSRSSHFPSVSADRVQIQQVLMNLMLNGIEAMNETGGVLTIKSQSEDGQIQISVDDTGPGLPPGEAGRIFDAFFTTKPQGSGMGLAISKSIVESHGGRIWGTANDGRGATFNFTLPAITAGSEASNAEE